jgi:hypothetical protein
MRREKLLYWPCAQAPWSHPRERPGVLDYGFDVAGEVGLFTYWPRCVGPVFDWVLFLHLLDDLGVIGIGAAIPGYHSKSAAQEALVEELDAPVG